MCTRRRSLIHFRVFLVAMFIGVALLRLDVDTALADKGRPQTGANTSAVGYTTIGQGIPTAPLKINVGKDASYQIYYSYNDASPLTGQFYNPGSSLADGGTFLWIGGQVYGPNLNSHSSSAYCTSSLPLPFGEVSQIKNGSGTTADPYRVTTTVMAGTVQLAETVTLIDGNTNYKISRVLTNMGGAAVSVTVFHAADLFLKGSDLGYGYYDQNSYSVGGYNNARDWFEIFTPIDPPDRHQEAGFCAIWQQIGGANAPGAGLNNTILPPDMYVDNGIALRWDRTIPANQTTTIRDYHSFGAIPVVPGPVSTLVPSSYDFGAQMAGTTSEEKIVRLINTGSSDLAIESLVVSGPNASNLFLAGGSCVGRTLARNEACAVVLHFSPATTGLHSASLVFTTNAPGSPHIIALSGNGLPRPGVVGCGDARPGLPPTAVAILVMGLKSSLTPLDDASHSFKPLDLQYCGLKNKKEPREPRYDYLQQTAEYFSPNSAASPNLTDSLAATGAVILPFSYKGAQLNRDANGVPIFTARGYTSDTPGATLPPEAAALLAHEVASIHRVWPSTRIVIVGHSEGGLVAETYFQQYAQHPTLDPQSNGVARIFSLDSPINGIAAPILGCATGICPLAGILIGPELALYYHSLWRNRHINNPAIIATSPAGLYVAVGTRGDLLYELAIPHSGDFRLRDQLFGTSLAAQLVFARENGSAHWYPRSPPSRIAPLSASYWWSTLVDAQTLFAVVLNSHNYVMGNSDVIGWIKDATTGAAPSASATTADVPGTSATGQLTTQVLSPGQSATITGTNLGTTAGIVAFSSGDGQPAVAAIASWTNTQILLNVPTNAATGPVLALTADSQTLLVGKATLLGIPNGVSALQAHVGAAAVHGQAVTVTITARDAAQRSVPNVPVSLSDGLNVSTVQTNASGVAIFTMVGHGDPTYIAFSGAASVPVAIAWQNPPVQTLDLVAAPSDVPVGQAGTVSATLKDSAGAPIVNQVVNFRVSGVETAILGRAQATTNAAGVATTTVISGGIGVAVVTAISNYDSLVRVVSLTWTPVVTYALTLAATPGGSVSTTPIAGPYPAGTAVNLSAAADAGYLFTGWTVDGQFRGWVSPLPMLMDGAHSVLATFAPHPSFGDVPLDYPAVDAITQLAARGVIKGCDPGATPPLFCPADNTLRAQMAALIVRAMGWSGESPANPFADRNGVDDELWRAIATLAAHDVARGYGDGTYGTTDNVLNAQVVSFVTRAMVARGYWQYQTDDGRAYPNIPGGSGHRIDVATYVHYAGALPDFADTGAPFPYWDSASTREWFARTLWQALDSHFGR